MAARGPPLPAIDGVASDVGVAALVAMLGLLGMRIFEASGNDIEDIGEEPGHGVLRVRGKAGKVVLVSLPPAVSRAIERSIDERTARPHPAEPPAAP